VQSSGGGSTISWGTVVVDPGPNVGTATSIALDSAIHIAYRDWQHARLKYARSSGAAWDIQPIANLAQGLTADGRATSIAVRGGMPTVAAQGSQSVFTYTLRASWTEQLVESGISAGGSDPAQSVSLRADAAGVLYLAYQSTLAPAGLRYTSSPIVPQSVFAHSIGFPSIALDSGSSPHIAFFGNNESGSSDFDLMYTSRTGNSWQIETVDPGNWAESRYLDDTGQFASLAIDAYGDPHIAYYASADGLPDAGHLRYARRVGGIWFAETVDASNGVGTWCSLDLDAAGSPTIAYYDHTLGDLKVARGSASGWAIDVVDSAGDVGSYASLRLDGSGRPYISYYDATNGQLKLAFGM
jgi:hypothetical protein